MAGLFVSIERAEEDSPAEYDGHKIVITGSSGYTARPISYGDARAELISAAGALQRFAAQSSGTDLLEGLKISNIELIYWINRSDIMDGEGEDTAVPAWMIETSKGEFFVEAIK